MGRPFGDGDTATSTPVILISQSMAKQIFGDDNPIGRSIRSWRDENVYREVVGVAADARYAGLGEEAPNVAYVPHTQNSWRSLMIWSDRPRSRETFYGRSNRKSGQWIAGLLFQR
jgi:hypothetical protein